MYLSGVALALREVTSSEHSCVTSVSFYAQLLLTEAVVDTSLLDLAIEMLLKNLKDHEAGQPSILRVICVHGLSGYKMDTLAKYASLNKHADLIIDTVMDTIGDDFESDEVNFVSLMTMVALLKVIPARIVICRMTQIGQYFLF